MPLNPNIALAAQGPQFTAQIESPVNQMAAMYQLQGAQQANQLRGMQMAAAQREIDQQNVLSDVYQRSVTPEGDLDYNRLISLLAQRGQGALVPNVQKAYHENQKIKTEQAKAQNELLDARLKRSRELLDTIDPNSPTAPQQYLAWHNANHDDPILGPELKRIGADRMDAFLQINQAIKSGKLGDMIEQSKLGVSQFREARQPKPQVMDLHDRSVIVDMNPQSPTFKQELSTATKGKTGHELFTEGQQTETLAETKRHNRATEGAAWQRLNAEMQAGPTITPQTLDMVANVYLQTGQLPPLGIGKQAATVKQQILNRATELKMTPQAGGAPGVSAADAASSIVTAKQDTASRGAAVKSFSTGVEGRAVRSFNTAIDHLETMDKLATALDNNDTRAFNSVGNFFAKQTGSAAPANFEAAKAIVGGEVAKALTGSNMALKDREEIRDAITSASSPAQLKGTLATLKQLLGGQLNSLNVQYETSTGRKDFEAKLTPAAKAELTKLRPAAPAAAPAKPAAPAVGTVKDGWKFKGGNPADKNNWERQ